MRGDSHRKILHRTGWSRSPACRERADRAGRAEVEGGDRRDQPGRAVPRECVDDEGEGVADDVEARRGFQWCNGTAGTVGHDDVDRCDIDRRDLHPMLFAQDETVRDAVVDGVGNVDRVRRVCEHAAVDRVERRPVQRRVGQALCAVVVDGVPVHDRCARVCTSARVGRALVRALRNVRMRRRRHRLVQPDLDDYRVMFHGASRSR